jgi:hypothetical protein
VRKATAAEVSDHRGATLTSIDVEDLQYSVMTTAKKCRIVWGTADVWILVILGLASCGLHAYVFIVYDGLPKAYTFHLSWLQHSFGCFVNRVYRQGDLDGPFYTGYVSQKS